MHKQHPQTAYRKYAVSIGTIFENCDKRYFSIFLHKQRACLSILRMGGFFCVSFDREGGKWYDSGIPKEKTARMGNAEPPESVADGYDEQQRAV